MTRSPLRLPPSLFLLRHMLPTRSCFTSPYRSLSICRTKAVCFRKHHLTLLLEQKANLLQAPAEVWGCEVHWKGTVVEFQCQAACWLVNQPSEPCQETFSFLSTSRRTTAPGLMAGTWNKTNLNGLYGKRLTWAEWLWVQLQLPVLVYAWLAVILMSGQPSVIGWVSLDVGPRLDPIGKWVTAPTGRKYTQDFFFFLKARKGNCSSC